MKILLTLDFFPEQGGIQRYLFNLVKYSYDKSDLVLVGSSTKTDKKPTGLPCAVEYFSNRFSKKNKKAALLNLFAALLISLIKFKKNTIVGRKMIYAAPFFLISLFLPVKYKVYCHGRNYASW